jgi:hypothetical protein
MIMDPDKVEKYLRDSIPQRPHPTPYSEWVSVRLDVVEGALAVLSRKPAEDERALAAGLIGQALIEVDSIHEAKPMGLAPTYYNDLHRPRDKRPFTLKDAKPRAKLAARYLREAWELIDPSIQAKKPGELQ